MFNNIPFLYKIGIFALIVVIFTTMVLEIGYFKGKSIVQDKWDLEKSQQETAISKEIAEIATKFSEIQQKAEEQHVKDLTFITNLRKQLSHGVPIHIPETSCKPETGSSVHISGRIFPSRVDEAFRHLQEGVGSIAEECDKLNIDTIKLNSTLKSNLQ